MNLKSTKSNLFTLIKVVSLVFIASGIGLELVNTYALLTKSKIPSNLNLLFWLERFAIAAHLIEGVIAAAYAPSRKQTPITYGIYTFFVGTVGLLELFDK
ncbi:MAG TPA: hypothetical protein DCE56_43595 [Cyanobacteria bacterium UBA8553]|nr:hypothetical protein [Cyanobacteria bacterium UBA8553]HAJ59275.1 hypothetical protein [Cyanobacteria bacterium UBA8543]